MKRLTPSLLLPLFALALAIPAGAAPGLAARPQAALLPALPRLSVLPGLSALPGLPPAAAAPREGQGETEREFYQVLRDFESADEGYRRAAAGSPAQSEAEQLRRALYDRGIGILTREGALLDSSAASLEWFALEMDNGYAPSGTFPLSLWEQLYGYATMHGWMAFTEATRRELTRETDWRRLLEKAEGFERSHVDTRMRRERGGSGWHPPSSWQLEAYAAVRDCAYQVAASLLEQDLASGRLSWREMEESAYGFERELLHASAGSDREEFFAIAMIAAFDAAFSGFERELVSGGLRGPDILDALGRAHRRVGNPHHPVGSAYDSRIAERIERYQREHPRK